jgi:hypothetical protein
MRFIPLWCAALALVACGKEPLQPPPIVDGGADTQLAVDAQPDMQTMCSADGDCETTDMCLGQRCVSRCAAPPATNLVKNPGFDQQAWADSDKDRGWGNEPPRLDPLDSVGCMTSGSLVVTQRTAFSPPFEIGPPGTKYYWGFRTKGTKTENAPSCEVHFCTDLSCTYFVRSDTLAPIFPSTDWQKVAFWITVPTPNPPSIAIPFARVACDTYGSQQAYFDRFYFSLDAQPY